MIEGVMANCEIIATGTELLLGYVVNTHPNYIAPRLGSLGIRVTRIVTVGDDRQAMADAVSQALQRADLVIVTGGLGPTSDDVTRDVVAELLGRRLREDKKVLAKIKVRFRVRRVRMPKAIAVQAQVPEGARVLPNDHGTAPGLAMEAEVEPEEKVSLLREPLPVKYGVLQRLVVLLPGPPRELQPMFDNHVMPLLRARGYATPAVCRVLRTVGVGESWVAEMVESLVKGRRDVELGYCARPNEVDVRLITRGPGAVKLADELEARMRARLGDIIFGGENDRLEDVVVRELIRWKRTLATAESCTGGLLASRITNVSGSSGVFMEGIVCYSNEAKMRDVGVRAKALKTHGAVSRPVARELAEGIRRRVGTDFGIGITGIAGPTGGTPKKPVGLVFIALAGPRGTEVRRMICRYDREAFKFVATQTALDMVRRALRVS
ncbi:MAG: competence/damage-inducible protein A [Verrucomicrobia bacterium]|nr:competence/damage-inducible protein A [Verrucomicrobiota bacterium]